MTKQELEQLADEGSIKATFYEELLIGSVCFTVCGIEMKAQFDSDNHGMYALKIDNDDQIVYALEAIRHGKDVLLEMPENEKGNENE